ncbi:tissue factor pathway inhibitor-like [Mytilus galloprovincialis]|uniref:tissue factor pathway inhibitor-like n=1 Tax=Mytilus galloprovincialis TaxID=29158 RepID=UPI003F7B661A
MLVTTDQWKYNYLKKGGTIPTHDSGPCGETDINFFFNSKTEQCEEFAFGGCEGNSNNFRTKQVCIKHCGKFLGRIMFKKICNLRDDPGPCEGSFTRYYYKDQTEQCEKFVYGGCDGNGNNFQSLIKVR